jgi:beta-glucanase (GH16 family)
MGITGLLHSPHLSPPCSFFLSASKSSSPLTENGDFKSQFNNLVWADEFNSGISGDWSYDIGGGGWGNNELEYYRSENAYAQNGNLVIVAKKESYGGYQYTSARLKTQGHRSWRYGRMEARIQVPVFMGTWPAFWLVEFSAITSDVDD